MYSFYIKNYQMDGSVITTETEVYSVPLDDLSNDRQFIDPCIKCEMGKTGSFDFTITPNNPFFSAWLKMKTLLRVEYDGTTIFRGRVITVDNNTLYGNRKIHAEGDLAFLLDSQQEGEKDDDRNELSAEAYIQQVITEHNRQMADESDKLFVVGEGPVYSNAVADEQKVKTGTRKYGSSSWQSTMAALENMQKTFGGFFRTRYQNGTCYLDWLESYYDPEINSQPIEVAKNLIDISDSSEVEDIFTGLIPVGSIDGKNLYLPEKVIWVPDIVSHFTDAKLNSGYHSKQDYLNAIVNHGHIIKVERFSNAETEEQLQEYALDYILHNYNGNNRSFTITAIDMHHVDPDIQKYLVGDRVRIIYPDSDSMTDAGAGRADVVLTMTAITYYPHDPENNEYTIGIPDSQMSKEYGTTKTSKTNLSSSSSNFSSIPSIPDIQDALPTVSETFDVQQVLRDYDRSAWDFIIDYRQYLDFCYTEHSDYLNLESAHPGASETYDVFGMAHDLLKRHMSTGDFGTASTNLLKAVVSKNANGSYRVSVFPAITLPSIEANRQLQDICNPIQQVLAAIISGYLGYINAHPDYLGNAGVSAVVSSMNGSGINLSSMLQTLLPQGITELANGAGFDVSGASSVFTNLLSTLGISTDNGILSLAGMEDFKKWLSPLTQILDGKGSFSLESLINAFPDLKDKIVNGALTTAATNWLKQKIPILKYALGSGQSQLTIDGIKNFLSNIPVMFAEPTASVSSGTGAVSGSSVTVGGGAASINQNGTITLSSQLTAMLTDEGHITRDSFLAVLPNYETGFVGSSSILNYAASRSLLKKFPELTGITLDTDGRIHLSALEARIHALQQEGSLPNTNGSSVVLDAATGGISGTGIQIGANPSDENAITVDIDGRQGIQRIGRDENGNWMIALNDTITYIDSNGVERTAGGVISAQDFHLDNIPSFKTHFAVIDELIAAKATIGQLEAAEARVLSLEAETLAINSSIFASESGIWAVMANEDGTLRSYIEATASELRTAYLNIHTNRTTVSDTNPSGAGYTPMDGDIWIESTNQGTWDGASGFDWQHDENYDWTQVQGARVWTWANNQWQLVADRQQLVTYSDFVNTADILISQKITALANEEGQLEVYRSLITQEGTNIRAEVYGITSDIYSYIDIAASGIDIAAGNRPTTIIQNAAESGVPTSVNGRDPNENDIWIDTRDQETWDAAINLSWEDDENFDWNELRSDRVYVYHDGQWHLAMDGTVLAEDTDLRVRDDQISLLARSIDTLDGYARSNFAQLEVRANEISSEVLDRTNGLGSKIDQTATQIRSEVHAANSNLYSYIRQTASDIRMEVGNTISGVRSSIQVESDRIGLLVEGTGSNASIRPAQIVASINTLTQESDIKIDASTVAVTAERLNVWGVLTDDTLTGGIIAERLSHSSNTYVMGDQVYIGQVNFTFTPATVQSGQNPRSMDLFERSGNGYVLTRDITKVPGKTYYSRSIRATSASEQFTAVGTLLAAKISASDVEATYAKLTDLTAEKLVVKDSVKLSNVLKLNTGGALVVERNAIFGASTGQTTTINNGTVYSKDFQISAGGKLVFVGGQNLTRNIDYAAINDMVTEVQLIDNQDNTYTLKVMKVGNPNGSSIGNFSRATALSGSWASGKFTVSAEPQGNIFWTFLSQGTVSWNGLTATIPIMAHDSSNENFIYNTGQNVNLDISGKAGISTVTRHATSDDSSDWSDWTKTGSFTSNGKKYCQIKITPKSGSVYYLGVDMRSTYEAGQNSIDISQYAGISSVSRSNATNNQSTFSGYTMDTILTLNNMKYGRIAITPKSGNTYYLGINASGTYSTAQNAVAINKGSWNNGIVEFTKSAGTGGGNRVRLYTAAPIWNGTTATVRLWDGTGDDNDTNLDTKFDVVVNASALAGISAVTRHATSDDNSDWSDWTKTGSFTSNGKKYCQIKITPKSGSVYYLGVDMRSTYEAGQNSIDISQYAGVSTVTLYDSSNYSGDFDEYYDGSSGHITLTRKYGQIKITPKSGSAYYCSIDASDLASGTASHSISITTNGTRYGNVPGGVQLWDSSNSSSAANALRNGVSGYYQFTVRCGEAEKTYYFYVG